MKPNKMLAGIVAATMTLAAVSFAVLAENESCTHDESDDVQAVAATCTNPGKEAGKVCKACGEYTEGGNAIAALGHDWGEPVDGVKSCKRDGCSATETVAPGSSEGTTASTSESGESTPGSSETQASGSSETQAPASSETQAPASSETEAPASSETEAPEETTTAMPDPIVYIPGASADSSSPEAVEHIVESPKDVAASRTPDLTVNAAESGVSADIVTAFANNKAAKTLTLKYSSTLKVAIAKEDISDAAADIDFSVSGKNFLNTKTIQKNKALNNATKIVQLDFVSTGKLDGVDKATIKSSVGMGYVGKTVTVYEMVNGKLVKVGVAQVNGAGVVKFDTDHLGQFVLAVK